MFIIDKPYASALLIETLLRNQFPVLRTEDAVALLPREGINFIEILCVRRSNKNIVYKI